MSPSRRCRSLAVAAMIGLAGVFPSLPAIADSPVTVTFQDHNPWTQEVGSVSRYDSWHEYSVAIAADKTLQINLISRNPNIYFTVRHEGDRNALIDTVKTGAKTWSTQNASAATYTIRVYIQPEAVARDDVAKYALQIGQYGQADLQPATNPVTFQPNNPWAQESGSLDSMAPAHDYTVGLQAGKTFAVNLIANNPALHFKVMEQSRQLVDTAQTGATKWSAPVATAGTYTIRVYVDPAAMPSGARAGYTLQVGQYGSAETRPATPPAAGSAIPPPNSALPPAAASSGG